MLTPEDVLYCYDALDGYWAARTGVTTKLPTANLVDNWDLSDAASITIATGISNVANQIAGGAAWAQAVAANQPLPVVDAKGRPGGLWDGVNDFMQAAGYPVRAQPYTIYVVYTPLTWVANADVFYFNGGTKVRLYNAAAAGSLNANAGAGTAAFAGVPVAAQPAILAMSFNGAASGTKLDLGAESVVNPGANATSTPLMVGGASQNAIYHQMCVYGADHNDTSKSAVIKALKAKWGI